jgi:hypothetical protein
MENLAWSYASNSRRYKSHVLVDSGHTSAVPVTALGVVSYFNEDEDGIIELTLKLDSRFKDLHDDSDEWDNTLWKLASTGPIKFNDESLRPCRNNRLRMIFKPRTDGTVEVPFTSFDGVRLKADEIHPGDLVIADFLFQVYSMSFDPRKSTEQPVLGTRHVLWSLQVLDPGFDLSSVPAPSRYPVMLTPKRVRAPL